MPHPFPAVAVAPDHPHRWCSPRAGDAGVIVSFVGVFRQTLRCVCARGDVWRGGSRLKWIKRVCVGLSCLVCVYSM